MVAQQGGQAFHGRMLGQHVQRELDAELHQDGVDHPGGVQRVAADAEEVLPDADGEAEDVLPLPGQPDLHRVPGALVAVVDRLVEGRVHGGVAPFSWWGASRQRWILPAADRGTWSTNVKCFGIL